MKKKIENMVDILDNDIVKVKNKKLYKVDREFEKATIVANSQAVYLSTGDDKLHVGNKDKASCYGIISASNLDGGYLMQNASNLISAFIINDIGVESIVFVLDSKIPKFYETIIFGFIFAVKKYSKQYGTKVFIKNSSNADSLGNAIMKKYNTYAREYLDSSVDEKAINRFYMISVVDYLNNELEQDKILHSLKLLLMKDVKSQDAIRAVEVSMNSCNIPLDKDNKKKIKKIEEMLYIQEHIYRAYRLSTFLESEIFNANGNTQNCLDKGIKETKVRREYEKKIHMLNLMNAAGFSGKGYN